MPGFIKYRPKGLDEIHEPGKNKVLGNVKVAFAENWKKHNSTGERQRRNGEETSACVSFSAANVLENILNFYRYLAVAGKANEEQRKIFDVISSLGFYHENNQANVSDRFIAKLSRTTKNGNDQKTVWDTIRHFGLIPEKDWPFVEGWDRYYEEIPDDLLKKGQKFIDEIEINYEFVKKINYLDALSYSPLQTSVFAWNGVKEGIYIKSENPLTHATTMDGYENKKYYYIFDSYEPFDKQTSWDFNFGWGVLPTIHLKKRTLSKFLRKYFRAIFK